MPNVSNESDMSGNDLDDEPISKTKRKQAMTDLQKLGAELVSLKQSQLDQLQLPELLLDAVLEAKRLTHNEARRRQMQYIGKVMRTVDAAPIQTRLDAWNGVNDQETARLHNIERWRERLMAEDAAVGEFLTDYPGCDSQQLRTLIRNARKEHAAKRPPASYRGLFRMLRDIMQTVPAANDDMA
jgi:ribosome-associated protein